MTAYHRRSIRRFWPRLLAGLLLVPFVCTASPLSAYALRQERAGAEEITTALGHPTSPPTVAGDAKLQAHKGGLEEREPEQSFFSSSAWEIVLGVMTDEVLPALDPELKNIGPVVLDDPARRGRSIGVESPLFSNGPFRSYGDHREIKTVDWNFSIPRNTKGADADRLAITYRLPRYLIGTQEIIPLVLRPAKGEPTIPLTKDELRVATIRAVARVAEQFHRAVTRRQSSLWSRPRQTQLNRDQLDRCQRTIEGLNAGLQRLRDLEALDVAHATLRLGEHLTSVASARMVWMQDLRRRFPTLSEHQVQEVLEQNGWRSGQRGEDHDPARGDRFYYQGTGAPDSSPTAAGAEERSKPKRPRPSQTKLGQVFYGVDQEVSYLSSTLPRDWIDIKVGEVFLVDVSDSNLKHGNYQLIRVRDRRTLEALPETSPLLEWQRGYPRQVSIQEAAWRGAQRGSRIRILDSVATVDLFLGRYRDGKKPAITVLKAHYTLYGVVDPHEIDQEPEDITVRVQRLTPAAGAEEVQLFDSVEAFQERLPAEQAEALQRLLGQHGTSIGRVLDLPRADYRMTEPWVYMDPRIPKQVVMAWTTRWLTIPHGAPEVFISPRLMYYPESDKINQPAIGVRPAGADPYPGLQTFFIGPDQELPEVVTVFSYTNAQGQARIALFFA